MTANASVSKAQLAQENLTHLSTIDTLSKEITLLKAQLITVTSVASALNKAQRGAFVRPQWQIERAEAMAAAKAQAIASHTMVRL